MNCFYHFKNTTYTILLLLLTICCPVAHAQLDSLLTAVKYHTQDDTTKVNLLSQLARNYREISPDSMISVANRGIAIAEKINYTKGKANCIRQVGRSYFGRNDYNKALYYYLQALPLYEKAPPSKEESFLYHDMAIIYHHQAKYEQSLIYFNKALRYHENTNDIPNIALETNNIGDTYSDMGNYTEGLNYYLKALRLHEKQNDKTGIAVSYSNIANIYSMLGDYKRALENINKCLKTQEGSSDKQNMVSNFTTAGSVYCQMKDYPHALAAFERGLSLADSIEDLYLKSTCLVDIADVYYRLEKYDSAQLMFEKGLLESEKVNDLEVIATAQAGVGSVLVQKGQVKEGIAHLLTAYGMMQKNGMKDPASTTASQLSEAYEKIKDYPKALEYHKIYYALRDSVYNAKNEKHIQQLQFDYELEKKESQIELLKKNKVIEQNRIEKQRLVMWGMLTGLLLLNIIIILLFRSRGFEKRSKEMILVQKEEIQHQADKLEELNRFKDKTFSVLSHDLRGPLDSFTATMTLLDNNLISPDEFAMLKPEVNKQLHSLNILLDNLLKWSKSHMQGDLATRHEKLDLRQITMQNIALIEDTASRKHITIENNIPSSIFAKGDTGQIDIVIRNLINNALKFTSANGSIALSASDSKDTISLTVTDTGVGMHPEQLAKLFTTSPDNSTYGTEGEKGVGLGLLLCYEFVKANNGTISATSVVGKGTTFTITLPKY